MPSTRFQPSFSGGVLGPGLHGRIDVARYDVGLKIGRNVFVHPHGGVSNRPGLEFIAEVADHTKPHRLIPFERDEDEAHVLVFGGGKMKVIDNGAYVQSGGVDYEFTTGFTAATEADMDFTQIVDVLFLADHAIYPQKLSRFGLDNWSLSNVITSPVVAAPTGVTVTPKNTGTETYKYVVTPIVGGQEGEPSAVGSATTCERLDIAGAKNTITWTGTADEYNVYRGRNGVFGYIGFTKDKTFDDDNIAPDLETTPPEAANIWPSLEFYPSKVTLFSERLVFANNTQFPNRVFMSQPGDYENFRRSKTLRASDRIRMNLSGQKLSSIKGLLPLRELMVFTSGGEFTISSGDGTMSATNPIQTQYGYSGAWPIRPLVVDDTALFVDRTGRQVRDLRYAFEQDGYTGNDLTIFASHFFEGRRIVGWTFARSPASIVWVYLDDGTLLSLTYKREHQVWGWTEHDVGGAVESAATITTNGEDEVFFVVRRTIGGVTKRYIERLALREIDEAAPDDLFFVDSGVRYSGAATTTITGLGHLEGETVVALADGSVVENLTVSGGAVTLPRAASLVIVGLPYSAEIENLPPAIELQDAGNARGRPIKASRLFIQMEKTRGIKAAATAGPFQPLIQTVGDLAQPAPLFTGLADLRLSPDWNKDGTVRIRQDHPLPMTILGISPDLSVGR